MREIKKCPVPGAIGAGRVKRVKIFLHSHFTMKLKESQGANNGR